MWRFPKIGVPPVIIHCSRIFPSKQTISGYPHFRKPPCYLWLVYLWHISMTYYLWLCRWSSPFWFRVFPEKQNQPFRDTSNLGTPHVDLVGGDWLPFFYFPIYWVANHPNWRNHIFQRGKPTTNQRCSPPSRIRKNRCRWPQQSAPQSDGQQLAQGGGASAHLCALPQETRWGIMGIAQWYNVGPPNIISWLIIPCNYS